MKSSLLVKVRLSPRPIETSAGRKRRPFCTMVWASSPAKAQTGVSSRRDKRAGRRIQNAPRYGDILLTPGRLNRPESAEKAGRWARKPGLDRGWGIAYIPPPSAARLE